MKVFPEMELYGNCIEAIEYYSSIFTVKDVKITTYCESLKAEQMSFSDQGRKMVEKAILTLDYNGFTFCIIMSDLLMVALGFEQPICSMPFSHVFTVVTSDESRLP
ncbi:MAG: hypothetical protein K6B75_07840, partial [Lachnospiraceae bacterium]|nr:hypothetical protein [Lachnospiraceae bacterium]